MQEYIELLKELINTPSVSGNEENAAAVMRRFLIGKGIQFSIKKHNTWAVNKFFTEGKPIILLNSHIDTVKPAKGWTVDPYQAMEEDGKLTGLGSCDAGGPLVSLLATFIHFYHRIDLPFNLIYAASAEEEISGPNGVEIILNDMPKADFAIVGEPTSMEVAIAEKGLMVLDCVAHGKSGHAARNEGVNALYKAMEDIKILRNYRFDKNSEVLGPVKISVTQINAGDQHNVVPDLCSFTADVRTNEHYSNHDIYKIISNLLESDVQARSFRLNSSGIDTNHPFAQKAMSLGIRCYGSPTTSDQAVIPYPSVKMGPGESAHSHTANEFIYKLEIFEGINRYIELLEGLEL